MQHEDILNLIDHTVQAMEQVRAAILQALEA